MTVGRTSTGSLADSLPTIIASARIVREFEGVMTRLVDKHTLSEGTGLDWNEISLAALTAQSVTETQVLDNPQLITDTLFSITPVVVGIHTLVTDRTKKRISANVAAKMGALAGNAMQRKKDQDAITILDGATTSLAGAGTTLTSGHVSAGVSRVRFGAGVEPSNSPIRIVLQSYQLKDIQDEYVAAVGTGVIDSGPTADVFRSGFYQGRMFGADVFVDDLISIDSSADAKGGIFAQEAIVLIQGHSPRTYTRERPDMDGADEMFMYDEYAYGERSAGNWLYEVYSDATAPSS